ncbi:hypothetical protein [Cupriavidus taiwanensis]|uniref:Uncharacterized protein n=1 Tax=Cupriavidus taiwanensis (strain DSM 17343 / BCRC 17206 / CCUG 44338 / CIP 107171 / LMG 19424 / R1) TaxID=977880 RepID=B3R9L5_CUPTR|nr:hypothetical protein [Cupriavidus taiwanensis]CAQ71590.1 hypothetical protein RALTA_B0979 [Cupriavidus taiwanensis LMG 19424]
MERSFKLGISREEYERINPTWPWTYEFYTENEVGKPERFAVIGANGELSHLAVGTAIRLQARHGVSTSSNMETWNVTKLCVTPILRDGVVAAQNFQVICELAA